VSGIEGKREAVAVIGVLLPHLIARFSLSEAQNTVQIRRFHGLYGDLFGTFL